MYSSLWVSIKVTQWRDCCWLYTMSWFLPCLDDVGTADTAMRSCSCTTEIGITVGAVIVVVCLIAIVITVIVVLCLRR